MMMSALNAIIGPRGRSRWHRFLLSAGIYSVAEGAAVGLAIPFLIDLLAGRTERAALWLIPIFGCVVIGWLAHFDMGLRALGLASSWRRTLYQKVGRKLVQLPIGWYDQDQTGRVSQLISGDITRVAGLVFIAQSLIGTVLTPVVVFVFLIAYDWRIALPALVIVPTVLLVFSLARRMTERTEAAHDLAAAQVTTRLIEFARAQPVLRATGRAEDNGRLLRTELESQHSTARREVLGALPSQYLGQLAIQLAFTAILLAGSLLATHTALSPARIVALVVAGIGMLRPFEILAGTVTSLRAGQAAVRRIRQLLATEPLPEPADPVPMGGSAIDVRDVHFRYGDGPSVLNGLSLRIRAGTMTALVGNSGAGKTTVTKLVARFFDVDSGSIRIGGVDVRELATADLMNSIAIVFQDVYLLDATIEENIRFGNPTASADAVRAAARRAQVDPVVARLPDGWATRVGEGGRLLSGGERQRVAIARALCKDAPIVLLDEATSSLDTASEAAVHAALAELRIGRTVLVIAHRLSTIAHADRIAMLESGRIVETGTHDELLRAGGRYADFWRLREEARGWRLTSSTDRAGTP
jgi:ATP-binding cassette subfamily B protein